jgi:hypothetical protein
MSVLNGAARRLIESGALGHMVTVNDAARSRSLSSG